MKAIVYRRYGGAEVLETVSDAAKPEPSAAAGSVLVKVVATSINPIDYKLASGTLRLVMPVSFPSTPCFDIAGVVVESGGDARFPVGARVNSRLPGLVARAAAEFVVTKAENLSLMPATLDMATAAALPLAGQTALQALRDHGGMPLTGATQRVLIVGASGGVGHFAVQIAKSAGARVAAVCSAKNREYVEGLGADEVYDYKAENPYANLAKCDIIFDCVGGYYSAMQPFLTDTGRFVSISPDATVVARSAINAVCNQKVIFFMLKPSAADQDILNTLFVEKKLRATVQRFPFDKFVDAWNASVSGRTVGKNVIEIQSE
ncbi:hypothetical protein HDU83_007847 [Entophlyctis luteolus]|nr:hypothetical protein HDU83_007847 [Entophlyctis luteolus]